MLTKDVAAQLGISVGRVGQIERRALTKLHILLAGEMLDEGLLDNNPKALRLLVAMCRQYHRDSKATPANVMAGQGLQFNPYGEAA